MKRFSARSLTKGRLGLGVKDEAGTIVFPFSLLDLLDIMEKLMIFRVKRLWLDLINKRPKDLDKGMKNLKLDIKNNNKNVIFT